MGDSSKEQFQAKPIKFQTQVLQTGKNTTGIKVPTEVIEELGGGKRPLIVVKINDYSYRSAIGSMGGKPMIPLSAANREAAGVKGGEQVDIAITLDLEPRTVTPPDDLLGALEKAGVVEAFEKSAPSMQKEYVRQVETAKKIETRERRIAKIVDQLSGK
ncbi:MAG: YdeI/OmpD-associated family protein [Anaerolineales bacterium]